MVSSENGSLIDGSISVHDEEMEKCEIKILFKTCVKFLEMYSLYLYVPYGFEKTFNIMIKKHVMVRLSPKI